MSKDDFFSKLNIKDYNNELEDILEKKSFSEGTKNILLNILYKIETSYEDYNKVKGRTKTKKEFLEEIINIIKNNCDNIEIVKIKLNEKTKLEDKKFKVEKEKKKIISYPSEKLVFYALYHLADKKFNVSDEYIIIKNPLEELLNAGYIMDKEEIIRDFDGWSWNIEKEDIENYFYNLIYQNIKMLFNNDFLQKIAEESNTEDFIQQCEQELKIQYDTDKVGEALKLIYQIAILLYLKNNNSREKEFLQIKKDVLAELKKMENKKEYLQNIANSKKTLNKKIKEIDEIISNNKLLRESFVEENKKLDSNSQIFSLSEYSEVLQNRRKQLLKQIDDYSELMKPINFVKKKAKLEKESLICEVLPEKEDLVYNLFKNLQNVFLSLIQEKIEKIDSKKEMQEYIYLFRYYKLLAVNNKLQIKDIEELTPNLRKSRKAFNYKSM